MAPTYRQRLRIEGGTLTACGLAASVIVVALSEKSTENSTSTIVQLAAVLVLMLTLGSWSVVRSLNKATALGSSDETTGEPTPLWQLPLIVAGLALVFGLLAWDAALRIGGGCLIVGLAQAVLFERIVAAREKRDGTRFFRIPGSSLFTGTKLGRS